MKTHDDPRLCASLDYICGRTRLILVDGKIDFARTAEMEALVKRERLTIVPRSELRAMTARFVPAANFESLDRGAKGRDDPEVARWKEVARLQERFRGSGDGWRWWGRYCSANPPATCLDILQLMLRVRGLHPNVSTSTWMPIDSLDLLRQALAEARTLDAGLIEKRLRELFRQAEGE